MKIVRVWVPIAVAVTLLCGLFYAVVQQNYRQTLNDPQVQIAEDVALLLRSGAKPTDLAPQQQIDIAASLSPWFAIYDANGVPVVSSGLLNGAMPQPPQGVFAEVLTRSRENRLSWQPQADVRQAIVVVETNDGFVVAGRNMRETERRISQVGIMVALGWAATLCATLIAAWLVTLIKRP